MLPGIIWLALTLIVQHLSAQSWLLSPPLFSSSTDYDFQHSHTQAYFHSRGWSPDTTGIDDYLQVDLLASHMITDIATMGSGWTGGGTSWDEWTTSYEIEYSLDASSWAPYGTTFTGNVDRTTIVSHSLTPPFYARYVRFIVKGHNTGSGRHANLRVNVRGFATESPTTSPTPNPSESPSEAPTAAPTDDPTKPPTPCPTEELDAKNNELAAKNNELEAKNQRIASLEFSLDQCEYACHESLWCRLMMRILQAVQKYLSSKPERRRLSSNFESVIVREILVNVWVEDGRDLVSVSIPFCGEVNDADVEKELIEMFADIVHVARSVDDIVIEKRMETHKFKECKHHKVQMVTIRQKPKNSYKDMTVKIVASIVASISVAVIVKFFIVR